MTTVLLIGVIFFFIKNVSLCSDWYLAKYFAYEVI